MPSILAQMGRGNPVDTSPRCTVVGNLRVSISVCTFEAFFVPRDVLPAHRDRHLFPFIAGEQKYRTFEKS